MSILTSPPALLTLADLLEHLGDIPAERVRLQPALGTATEQDVLDAHDREDRLCELVDGVLVEKAMGYYESRLAVLLAHILGSFLDQHNLGIVAGADGMMRLAPGQVRIPDVSFVAWERLPNRRVPRDPIPDLAPDLAVEVLSPSNTPGEMDRKLRDYFSAGVRMVWLLDARSRTLAVYTSPEQCEVIREPETVSGGDVLPGFTLVLGELFQRAESAPPGS